MRLNEAMTDLCLHQNEKVTSMSIVRMWNVQKPKIEFDQQKKTETEGEEAPTLQLFREAHLTTYLLFVPLDEIKRGENDEKTVKSALSSRAFELQSMNCIERPHRTTPFTTDYPRSHEKQFSYK